MRFNSRHSTPTSMRNEYRKGTLLRLRIIKYSCRRVYVMQGYTLENDITKWILILILDLVGYIFLLRQQVNRIVNSHELLEL